MLGRGLESLIPPSSSQSNQGGDDDVKKEELKERSVFLEEKIISVKETVGSEPKKEEEKNLELEETADEINHLFNTSVPHILEDKIIDETKLSRRTSFVASRTSKELMSDAVFHIEVEKIKPNPYQPRREFNEDELRELAHSIREFGIIQPLVVSKIEKEVETGTDVEYQLVAGERRLRAAKMVGLERVPAIVKKVDTNKLNLELSIIENVQRSNLNPLESARAYSRLQDEFNLTQREIAARVSKSRESVANTLRLLNLPSHMQDALNDGRITESQARILLSIEDLQQQQKMFFELLGEKMSVRRLKEKVAAMPDPERNYFEKQLEEKLGSPVVISRHGGKGKLVVKFFSEEEMRGVLQKLLGDDGL